jgi:hypothetical protein
MGIKCAEEVWLRPVWLDESYQPQYAFELPKGITVPTIDTTTYKLVVVNEEDDISPEQVEASGKKNPVPTEACVVRVHPVGDAGTRARDATCEQTCVCKATSMRTPRTLRTAGITRERERPGVDIPSARTAAYGIPGVAEVKASMERAHRSAR